MAWDRNNDDLESLARAFVAFKKSNSWTKTVDARNGRGMDRLGNDAVDGYLFDAIGQAYRFSISVVSIHWPRMVYGLRRWPSARHDMGL